MMVDDKTQTPSGIWGVYALEPHEQRNFKIGPLEIRCLREKQELRICWVYEQDNTGPAVNTTPEEKDWYRWAFKQSKPKIELKPVFPDRPLCVYPENPFKISEDAAVKIYVRVPIWVSINLIGNKNTKLVEIPVITLSKTWFGSFTEGELCYWLSSGARLTVNPDPNRPYMAICPLMLIDRSPEDLDVNNVCLRVENLSLFQEHNQLWADETRITYRGNTEASQSDFSGRAPAETTSATLCSRPRSGDKKSINAKTFSTFKELPGLGFFLKE